MLEELQFARYSDYRIEDLSGGTAILIVSHMITENKRLDRVLNLRDGHIVD